MKKIFAILSFVVLFTTNMFSQVYHREYDAVSAYNINSSVSVIVNSTTSYLISTDGTYTIDFQRLSTNTMLPNNIYSYIINQPLGVFHFEGAFLDSHKDIIVYGYIDESDRHMGMALKYHPGTTLPLSIFFIPRYSTRFISGCLGHDYSGNDNYAFITEKGILFSTDIAFGLAHNGVCVEKGYYSYVSWDDKKNKYCVSGTICAGSSNFSTVLSFFEPDLDINTAISYAYKLNTTDPILLGPSQGRAVHAQIKDNEFAIFQEAVLDQQTTPCIWATIVNKSTGMPVGTEVIDIFPDGPLTITDVDYNDVEHRLLLLGRQDYCNSAVGKNYVLQIDPFNIGDTHKKAIYISDFHDMVCNPIAILPYNDIILKQILYNKYTNDFFISGINKDHQYYYTYKPYGIKVYNSNSLVQCNEKYSITTIEKSAYKHDVKNYDVDVYHDKRDTFLYNWTTQISATDLCSDPHYYPDNYNKSQKVTTEDEIALNIANNEFICNSLYGNCHYEIFDIAGKLVFSGSTPSNKYTSLPSLKKGVYIIKVVDEKHTCSTKKFVIL